jgi:hypothetical protein
VKVKFIKQIKDNNIIYCDDNYNKVGNGFLTYSEDIALLSCPKCRKENHESNVIHGLCAWCGFDANEDN